MLSAYRHKTGWYLYLTVVIHLNVQTYWDKELFLVHIIFLGTNVELMENKAMLAKIKTKSY